MYYHYDTHQICYVKGKQFASLRWTTSCCRSGFDVSDGDGRKTMSILAPCLFRWGKKHLVNFTVKKKKERKKKRTFFGFSSD